MEPVLATKYSLRAGAGHSAAEITANSTGNSTKSMRVSLDASLRRLKTDYIDVVRLILPGSASSF